MFQLGVAMTSIIMIVPEFFHVLGLHPLSTQGFSKASFSNCMFVKKKRGGTVAIFMYYWMTLGKIHALWVIIYIDSGQCLCTVTCIHALLDFEDVTNGR